MGGQSMVLKIGNIIIVCICDVQVETKQEYQGKIYCQPFFYLQIVVF